MAHPNAELVGRGYEALGEGDLDTSWSCSPTTSRGTSPGTAPSPGPPSHALAIVEAHAERNGKGNDFNAIHVWHLRDGKAEIFRSVPVDAYAYDALPV